MSIQQKTGLLTCFFLLFIGHLLLGQKPQAASKQSNYLSWRFDPLLSSAYTKIFDLETSEAIQLLGSVQDPKNRFYKIYLQSLAETVDLLITEDESRFPVIEKAFKERLVDLEDAPPTAESLFLQAELNLQRGFCYLNLGENLSAIWAIRQAYNLAQECQQKFPGYVPILKTNGLLQVMLGAVPDKYRWFFTLLGMEGSVENGQKQLNSLRQANISLSKEAGILFYTIKGLISQEFTESNTGIASLLREDPSNRLLHFLGVTLLMKESRSEEAYQLIKNLDQKPGGLPLVYMEYLRGEIQLQKGSYSQAIQSFQRFLSNYKGSSFKKDASLKISLSYHLMNKNTVALQWWNKAKETGKAIAEPDVNAADMLNEQPFPDELLLKIRFLTDGGYLFEARQLLESTNLSHFKTKKNQTEYIYRKARLEHKSKNTELASRLYDEVITRNKNEVWYFGASSALQMGYLARERKDYSTAKKYFNLTLSFRDHPYKNSIDGKARAALEELKTFTP